MILGIGNDIIEIERVRKACLKEAFLVRTFTKGELEKFKDKPEKLAGCFAVKEAFSKSLGTGFRGFKPNEVEVLRDELGMPFIKLYGNALLLAENKNINKLHATISNTKEVVYAVVIAE